MCVLCACKINEQTFALQEKGSSLKCEPLSLAQKPRKMMRENFTHFTHRTLSHLLRMDIEYDMQVALQSKYK